MPPPTEPSPLAWELARSLRLRFLWCFFFFRPLLPPPLAGPGEKPVFILERRYQDCEGKVIGEGEGEGILYYLTWLRMTRVLSALAIRS